jgi:hypothetical protein
MEEPLEEVFSVGSMPKLHKKSVWRCEYAFGLRWEPPCMDVSPEAEERPPLEAVTKQRDWRY